MVFCFAEVRFLLMNAAVGKNALSPGVLVRAAHVILTWLITLLLFVQDTDLRRQEQSGHLLQPGLFLLLVLLSVLLYLRVSLMDPGFVRSDAGPELSAGLSVELHQMLPQPYRRRCGRCLLQQPMRSRHCQTCRYCVRRYDHHCPWIENCVGERNHRWFVLYLAVQLLVLLWGLRVACSGFLQAPAWGQWLEQNGFLLLASSATGIFSVVVVLLLGSHLYLISHNTTTWEFMSSHRISYLKHRVDENPFDRGILRNLWGFFCARREIAWEGVYAKVSASLA
ncbi:palmitoyltransferase ZDHHC12-A [Brienomyrus brachyistius]|uniref:palmitoyltransferase ZDHHC12-A n=1 Tax=Brienomyrus brachyistius TaxID=42636 RepID=UPI0020B2D2FC|nr:palmitoyltransferase ZDHHC12-A [Brienomyrus brachyistius]